jgi:hypothetical protein
VYYNRSIFVLVPSTIGEPVTVQFKFFTIDQIVRMRSFIHVQYVSAILSLYSNRVDSHQNIFTIYYSTVTEIVKSCSVLVLLLPAYISIYTSKITHVYGKEVLVITRYSVLYHEICKEYSIHTVHYLYCMCSVRIFCFMCTTTGTFTLIRTTCLHYCTCKL